MPWAERVRLPLLLALMVLVADQLVKWWMLEGLALRGDPRVIEILPFFNLVMVWNTGVSFGLLGGGPEMMRWLLTGLAIAISAGLAVWIARSPSAFLRFCLAAVIGGAIGNAIDRIRFGAVADFFDLHAFGWHWPAFNIADAAIVIGVLLLLAEPLIAPRPMGEKEGDDPARKDLTAP